MSNEKNNILLPAKIDYNIKVPSHLVRVALKGTVSFLDAREDVFGLPIHGLLNQPRCRPVR